MTVHLTLLCHAATASTRDAAFPGDDEALDPRAAAALAGLGQRLGHADRRLVGPALRARDTAARLGLAADIDAQLRDCDFGAWRGSTLAAVQARDPEGLAAWLRDPASTPHGGESVTALVARLRGWLDTQGAGRGLVLAVTHAAVIRAAIVAAIEAGPGAFWRIDIPPLARVRLSGHGGRWTLVGLGRLDAEPPAP